MKTIKVTLMVAATVIAHSAQLSAETVSSPNNPASSNCSAWVKDAFQRDPLPCNDAD